MKLLLRLTYLAVAIALGWWLWSFSHPNPRTIIKNRLHKLAQLVSYPAREGNLARIANVEKIGQLFANDVEVVIDAPDTEPRHFSNRQELMQAAMVLRGAVNGVSAEFVDPAIEWVHGSDSAIVNLTLNAKVGADKEQFVLALKFTMKKIDGDWLITRIDSIKTFK